MNLCQSNENFMIITELNAKAGKIITENFTNFTQPDNEKKEVPQTVRTCVHSLICIL